MSGAFINSPGEELAKQLVKAFDDNHEPATKGDLARLYACILALQDATVNVLLSATLEGEHRLEALDAVKADMQKIVNAVNHGITKAGMDGVGPPNYE